MPDDRLAELLSLGENSLRKLADSARQIQDSINKGNRAASALEAVGKLKSGIFQMRNIFAEARKVGGVSASGLNHAQNIFSKAKTGATNGVMKGYPVVREAAQTAMDRSEAFVKAQPVKGLLACLGLGLLLGVLIGR